MKYARVTFVLGALASVLVAGALLTACQPRAAVTNAPAVSAQASQAQWQVVLPKTNVGEKWRMAAFSDQNFGLTGGAGDVGKARYTSDGGKTWTVADSSGG